MNCKETEDLLVDFINQNLDPKTYDSIATHIESCENCSVLLNELQTVFEEIDHIPMEIPDERLKINFEKMLQKEKALLHNPKVVSLGSKTNRSWKTAIQIAATVGLVLSGYFYGKYHHDKNNPQEVAVLENETTKKNKTLALSMIENESASKRIQAVNYAEALEKPGNEILKALISKMHSDDHSNVRLAAAEALVKFSESEIVRKAFINALDTEQDPDIQIELIQILVSIQEKRAVPSMEKLLQNEETLNYVKDQVKVGLPTLI